uniref:Genome sequencing data, contig C319 n=1 Tax=Microcystis aeruginosa (strain PCC 7806) TaxID=267872 RepID=A8YJ18_MICA7|nr:unnamed protein product [Microcystis aeruginosa PCC 7806]
MLRQIPTLRTNSALSPGKTAKIANQYGQIVDNALIQLSVISYQLSVTSYQLSVTSYQLSVTSYQLPVISYQLSR